MQKVKKFKDLPWTEPTYDSPWYCSYDPQDPRCREHRIYVPKENNIGCITAAFGAAYQVGNTMVGLGQWAAFRLVLERGELAGQTIDWPILNLLPIMQNEGGQQEPGS